MIIIYILSIICIIGSYQIQFLKFVNQSEGVLDKATNYATLGSGIKRSLPTTNFTICGSIFVEFFRTYTTFFVVRKSSDETLWFNLYLQGLYVSSESYLAYFHYHGGGYFPNTNSTLPLRPHSWSHACVAVNAATGQVMVVINGLVTHDIKVESRNFIVNEPFSFEKHILLGAHEYNFSASTSYFSQSEAAVSNVNIFSSSLSTQEMVKLTTNETCKPGDVLSWTEASWRFTGHVQASETQHICKTPNSADYSLFPSNFYSCFDCIKLCPRIQTNGRVPLIQSYSEFEIMKKLYQKITPNYKNISGHYIWSSYTLDDNYDEFRDFYTKAVSPHSWTKGEPDGGKKQPCSGWWKGATLDDGLWDTGTPTTEPGWCFCQFTDSPILKLRGLCRATSIDTHYTPVYQQGQVAYKGLKSTEIRFYETTDDTQWKLKVNQKRTSGQTSADEISYVLGTHLWQIVNDTAKCKSENLNLKMTGCSEGQFTCDNGDCVKMEERCDQLLDCEDKSDELNCRTVILEKSYRKTAPPLGIKMENHTRKVTPAEVKISMTLLDISAIRETDNEIDIKFTAEFEWVESRAMFHNLKTRIFLNTLDNIEMGLLWIPKLIYRNNKDNFDTRSALDKSELKINRKGNFTRSPLEVVDEIEIFQGQENPIIMIQSYTNVFRCNFYLVAFPFDTQVNYQILLMLIFKY